MKLQIFKYVIQVLQFTKQKLSHTRDIQYLVTITVLLNYYLKTDKVN